MKFVLPLYTAVIEYVAGLEKLVVMLACLAATVPGDPICAPFE
jgi:hypothetical protein